MRKTKEGKWILGPARPHDTKEKISGAEERLNYLDRLDTNKDLDKDDLIYYHEYKGNALRDLDKKDAAIKSFITAIELASKVDTKPQTLVQLHRWIGELYSEKKDFKNSLPHFLQATKNDPDHTSGLLEVAQIYVEIGNFENAKKSISELESKERCQDYFDEYLKPKLDELRNKMKGENAKK